MMINRAFAIDLAERSVSTYFQTFLGLLIADSSHVLNMATDKAAAIAALPAALSVLKSALAGSLKFDGTAALVTAADKLGAGMGEVVGWTGDAEPTDTDATPAADEAPVESVPVPASVPVAETAAVEPGQGA